MTFANSFKRFKPRPLPEYLQVPWGLADIALFIALWIGLQVVIIFVLSGLQHVWPLAQQAVQAIRDDSIVASLILSLLNAVIGFGVLAFILKRRHVGWRQLGWRRVGLLRTIGYLVGIMVVFLAVVSALLWVVSVFVPGFNANEAQTNTLTNGVKGQYAWAAFIGLVIVPPILEETIFRGFLFPALSKRVGLIGGAIISSLLFGMAHFQANVSIYTWALGLLLCFMYVRLRSIVPGILLHMLNNFFAFLYISGR